MCGVSNLPNSNELQLIIHRLFNQSYFGLALFANFFCFSLPSWAHAMPKKELFCRPFQSAKQSRVYVQAFFAFVGFFNIFFFIVSSRAQQLHPICVSRNRKAHWIEHNFPLASLKFIQTHRYWFELLCFPCRIALFYNAILLARAVRIAVLECE